MKTIKAKNGEWVNLSNHLPQLTEVEGKTFALAVAKNIAILKENLTHLEGVLAATPEFAELSEKAEEVEIGIEQITEEMYPETITAKQIIGLTLLN